MAPWQRLARSYRSAEKIQKVIKKDLDDNKKWKGQGGYPPAFFTANTDRPSLTPRPVMKKHWRLLMDLSVAFLAFGKKGNDWFSNIVAVRPHMGAAAAP